MPITFRFIDREVQLVYCSWQDCITWQILGLSRVRGQGHLKVRHTYFQNELTEKSNWCHVVINPRVRHSATHQGAPTCALLHTKHPKNDTEATVWLIDESSAHIERSICCWVTSAVGSPAAVWRSELSECSAMDRWSQNLLWNLLEMQLLLHTRTSWMWKQLSLQRYQLFIFDVFFYQIYSNFRTSGDF